MRQEQEMVRQRDEDRAARERGRERDRAQRQRSDRGLNTSASRLFTASVTVPHASASAFAAAADAANAAAVHGATGMTPALMSAATSRSNKSNNNTTTNASISTAHHDVSAFNTSVGSPSHGANSATAQQQQQQQQGSYNAESNTPYKPRSSFTYMSPRPIMKNNTPINASLSSSAAASKGAYASATVVGGTYTPQSPHPAQNPSAHPVLGYLSTIPLPIIPASVSAALPVSGPVSGPLSGPAATVASTSASAIAVSDGLQRGSPLSVRQPQPARRVRGSDNNNSNGHSVDGATVISSNVSFSPQRGSNANVASSISSISSSGMHATPFAPGTGSPLSLLQQQQQQQQQTPQSQRPYQYQQQQHQQQQSDLSPSSPAFASASTPAAAVASTSASASSASASPEFSHHPYMLFQSPGPAHGHAASHGHPASQGHVHSQSQSLGLGLGLGQAQCYVDSKTQQQTRTDMKPVPFGLFSSPVAVRTNPTANASVASVSTPVSITTPSAAPRISAVSAGQFSSPPRQTQPPRSPTYIASRVLATPGTATSPSKPNGDAVSPSSTAVRGNGAPTYAPAPAPALPSIFNYSSGGASASSPQSHGQSNANAYSHQTPTRGTYSAHTQQPLPFGSPLPLPLPTVAPSPGPAAFASRATTPAFARTPAYNANVNNTNDASARVSNGNQMLSPTGRRALARLCQRLSIPVPLSRAQSQAQSHGNQGFAPGTAHSQSHEVEDEGVCEVTFGFTVTDNNADADGDGSNGDGNVRSHWANPEADAQSAAVSTADDAHNGGESLFGFINTVHSIFAQSAFADSAAAPMCTVYDSALNATNNTAPQHSHSSHHAHDAQHQRQQVEQQERDIHVESADDTGADAITIAALYADDDTWGDAGVGHGTDAAATAQRHDSYCDDGNNDDDGDHSNAVPGLETAAGNAANESESAGAAVNKSICD